MTQFDKKREGSGTKEWAEETINIQVGCANDCLYCYAAANAANPYFGARKPRAEWTQEQFSKRAEIKSYPAKDGVVMFPTTHDITPFNLEQYTRVAKLILAKGNQLLIVTKPRFECISHLLGELRPYREQILFRFTIGSMTEKCCALWEPGAPSPAERVEALAMAKSCDFNTSVSIEPILGGLQAAMEVVQTVDRFVTETIWIGKMNNIYSRVDMTDPVIKRAVQYVEHLQRDEEMLDLVTLLKDNPKIRWKKSIQDLIDRAAQKS